MTPRTLTPIDHCGWKLRSDTTLGSIEIAIPKKV